jgi:hypothetical protein
MLRCINLKAVQSTRFAPENFIAKVLGTGLFFVTETR